MGSLRGVAFLAAFALAPVAQAAGCEMPDEGGMPLRRAVTRVKLLPETEAWVAKVSTQVPSRRTVVQFVLSLDDPRYLDGRCYWPVEVRADGKLWKRFLVTPDGRRVLADGKS